MAVFLIGITIGWVAANALHERRRRRRRLYLPRPGPPPSNVHRIGPHADLFKRIR
jgi:hypothetical protein